MSEKKGITQGLIAIIVVLAIAAIAVIGIDVFVVLHRNNAEESATERHAGKDLDEGEQNDMDQSSDTALAGTSTPVSGGADLKTTVDDIRNSVTFMKMPWREYINQYASGWADGNNDFSYSTWPEFKNQNGNVTYKSYVREYQESRESLNASIKSDVENNTQVDLVCSEIDGTELIELSGWNIGYDSGMKEMEGLAPWIIDHNVQSAKEMAEVLGLDQAEQGFYSDIDNRQMSSIQSGDYEIRYEPSVDIEDSDTDIFWIYIEKTEKNEVEVIRVDFAGSKFSFRYAIVNETNRSSLYY